MTTSDKIQAIIAAISALGFLGLIVSVLILNNQTNQATKATFATVYQGIAAQMQDLDKLFIEMPDLRPYIYRGKPLPDDERERDKVLATAELLVDLADHFIAQSPLLPQHHQRGWVEYFGDMYRTSPAIRHYWSECGEWYCSDLQELYAAAALRASSPAISDRVPADAVPA